jgi:hypothetical protein
MGATQSKNDNEPIQQMRDLKGYNEKQKTDIGYGVFFMELSSQTQDSSGEEVYMYSIYHKSHSSDFTVICVFNTLVPLKKECSIREESPRIISFQFKTSDSFGPDSNQVIDIVLDFSECFNPKVRDIQEEMWIPPRHVVMRKLQSTTDLAKEFNEAFEAGGM